VAESAEQAGVDRISVMDHVWQVGHLGPPELAHKLDVLREHCAAEDRDYAEIEKTGSTSASGENIGQIIEHLHELAELGIQVAHGTVMGAGSLQPLDLMAEHVIPVASTF